MIYTVKDTAEGFRITLKGGDITNPRAWAILLAGGATNRDHGAWTVKTDVLAEVTAELDAWIAADRPAGGIAAGEQGPFVIGHADGRYTVKSAKSFAPALKRLDGVWDAQNTVWIISAGKEQDLQKLIAKSTKAAAAAGGDTWPEIKGLTITVRNDGTIGLAFAYDDALKDAIKGLPTARWDPPAKQWIVSTRYRAAVRKKLVELAGGFTAAKEAVDQRAADLVAKIDKVRIVSITQMTDGLSVKFSYDAEIVNICRSAGLRWNGQTFAGSIGIVAKERLVDGLLAIQGIRAAKPAPAPVARPVEPHRFASRRPSLFYSDGKHAEGDVLRTGGRIVTVTDVSRPYRAPEDIGSVGGQPWMEGEYVVDVNYRDATANEIAYLEINEAAAAENCAVKKKQADAVKTVFAGSPAPATGSVPTGETLWENGTSALIGYHTWIISDGTWLYGITYDGSDGGTWGDFNLGYNTRGTMVPFDAALAEAIRGDFK